MIGTDDEIPRLEGFRAPQIESAPMVPLLAPFPQRLVSVTSNLLIPLVELTGIEPVAS